MKQRCKLRTRAAMALFTLALAIAAAVPALAAVRLPEPQDVYWGGSNEDDEVENGTYAYWDEIEDAYEYEVYLYRDENKVKEITTKKTRYNFSKLMTEEGEYTFRVRAVPKKGSREYVTSYWSEYSDSTYMDADRIQRIQSGVVIDSTNSGPGATNGQWMSDTTGWRYRKPDGSYAAGGWFQDPADSNWYFFDEAGYMMTGWIDWNGQRYYCDAEGSPSGAMVTGGQVIDGMQYMFDESGALQ